MEQKTTLIAMLNTKIYHFYRAPLFFVLAAVIMVFMQGRVWGQIQSQTFNSNGTFTVPAGVTTIVVQAWGGGGCSGNNTSGRARGGGGGGAFTQGILTVTPGSNLAVIVGAGGIYNDGNTSNDDGGNSSMGLIIANGGSRGVVGSNVTTNGGAGGTASTNPGSIANFFSFTGGNGGNGYVNGNNGGGGGGGESASNAGIGNSGGNGTSGGTGGLGGSGNPSGGDGGRGADNDGNPNSTDGIVPGGGGGGRADDNGDNTDGARGRVIVYYNIPYLAQFTAMDIGSVNWCAGETRTVSVTVKNIGTATWNTTYTTNIGIKWNSDGDYPGAWRVSAGNLAPGSTQTYNLTVTAPLTAGAENLTFDVVNEGNCWFGNNNGSCGPGNTVYTSAALTVNALPATPTGIAATPSSICAGGSSTISVNNPGAGLTTDWFTVSCGGTAVPGGTGVNSLSVSPGSTTTYYARTRNTTTGCVSASCANVAVTVNTLPATPTNPTASPSTICNGQSSNLSATVGGGETVDWFTGSCGGTPVSSPVSPATTTTYYARARNTTTGCVSSACATVAVNVNPLPSAPSGINASPASICSGASSTISVTDPGAGFTTDWYTVSCGGTAVPGGTGVNSLSVSPSSTTTYYARTRNTTTGCVSASCPTVTVTVNSLPATPTGIAAAPSSICAGGSSTISVNNPGAGLTTDWFTVSCGGTAVPGGTGVNSLSVSPGSTTTYYARTRNTTTGCVSASCANVAVTVNTLPATPTNPTASPSTICNGQSSNLSATVGGGETVDWFTGSCGGTPVSSPVSPATTTTYYARARNTTTGCVSSACATVAVNVNPLPSAPSGINASPASICSGASSTISVTDPGAGFTTDWYTVSCGGTAVPGGTGVNSLSVSPSSTTTYYARTRNTTTGCVSATCPTVTVTVNALPATPTGITAAPSSICAGGSSTISVNNPGAGLTTDWFTLSCGGTAVPGGTGVNSLSVSPGSTTTYYARTRNTTTGCVSASCANVAVTVNTLPATPTNPTASPSMICIGQSSTLSAAVGGGETVDWFTGSCGGTPVSSPVSPATTTTYYARARNTTTGCVSTSCTTVTVTVNPLPALYTLTGGGTYCAGSSGAPVGLSGSESGVSYQLKKDGFPDGSLPGTGAAIDFGDKTAGTYTVTATNLSTNCVREMTGSAVCTSSSTTSQTFNTAGTFSFTTLYGVTSVTVEVWGGGGAGGGGFLGVGGGGGGGGYSKSLNVTVTPGTTYSNSVVVGSGGTSSGNPGSASNATLGSSVTTANGGGGGVWNGEGGSGGSGNLYTGGSGSVGQAFGYGGGGGGGSAGTGSNGNSAVGTSTGAAAVTGGGAGGDGNSNGNGSNGDAPGGGGGGGAALLIATGGDGGTGQVIISWNCAAPVITSFSPAAACSGSGATVTIYGSNFTGATSVTFNGTSASFTVDNDGQITATLPAGATTGLISVTTPGGTGSSGTNFTVNPLPTFTATKNDPSCFNSGNGTITITAAGGSGTGYEYRIYNGTTWIGWQSGNVFNNLPAGTYTIEIKDSNGCVQVNGTVIP